MPTDSHTDVGSGIPAAVLRDGTLVSQNPDTAFRRLQRNFQCRQAGLFQSFCSFLPFLFRFGRHLKRIHVMGEGCSIFIHKLQ
jgi:hypothetical protein